MASRVKGVTELRRMLRKLPDDITAEIKREVKTSAEQVLAAQRSEAPHSSIRDALSVRIRADGLSATVGLIGKRAARKGFLARIFEFGAKPHVIAARGRPATAPGARRRRRRKGEGARVLVTAEGDFLGREVQHPGMAKRPFFFPVWAAKRPAITRRLMEAIYRALRKA